jgi:hypothetical protein
VIKYFRANGWRANNKNEMDNLRSRITAGSHLSKLVRFTLLVVLAVGSSACGGGGGSSAPANHAPTANAGNAQTIFKRAQARSMDLAAATPMETR